MRVLSLLAILSIVHGAIPFDPFIFAQASDYMAQSPQKSKSKPPANVMCLVLHCFPKLLSCFANSECSKTTSCIKKCDPSDFECSNNCFFMYSNDPFNKLVQCGVKNQCLPKLSFSDKGCPNQGSIPNRRHDISNRVLLDSVDANQGVMYVAAGSDRVFDCFDCQQVQFTKVDEENVLANWTTSLDRVNVRGATYTLHQQDDNTLITRYSLFGMQVEEHYYMLDYTEDGEFVFYFYCGYGFDSEYNGAVVYSRQKNAVLSESVKNRFNTVIMKAGLTDYVTTLDGFCSADYSGTCPNIE